MSNENNPKKLFEIGRLYCEKCDFTNAVSFLKNAGDLYFQIRDFNGYLNCQNLLLRIFAEKDDQASILTLKEFLQDLVIKEGLTLTSRIYYTLGLCSSYRQQNNSALDYLKKSLSIAQNTQNMEDLNYALYGVALCKAKLGLYSEALQDLEILREQIQKKPNLDLIISEHSLFALIQLNVKNYELALSTLWDSYDLLKVQKNLWMYIYILFNIGKVYLEMGNITLAKMYLNLAFKTVDANNLPRLSKQIQIDLELAKTASPDEIKNKNFDLLIELDSNAIIEKSLGRVEFKNQHTLFDLLKLLTLHQGKTYSKEHLVEHIWNETYDPSIHDNKIYVTIKRLRKMIEPNFDDPKYLLRTRDGYFVNKSIKIQFINQGASEL